MQYKVGDKVRIINPSDYMAVPKYYIGTILIIDCDALIFVECKCDKDSIAKCGSRGWWFRNDDLEQIEYQMVFPFMNER